MLGFAIWRVDDVKFCFNVCFATQTIELLVKQTFSVVQMMYIVRSTSPSVNASCY